MQVVLSVHNVKTSITNLVHKKLVNSVTYMHCAKYSSTKIKSADKLRELIKNKKSRNCSIRYVIEDYKWSVKTKEELFIMGSTGMKSIVSEGMLNY